jgi:hypothetical protein
VTREEILALTDDEMRIEVAKARGFHVEAIPSNPPGTKPLYALVDAGGDFVGDWYYSPANCWRSAPNYPGDISAAWPLALEFSEQKNKNFSLSHSNVTDKWNCLICHSQRIGDTEYIMGEAGMGEGDTAPEAICRAYLLAKAVHP